MFMFMWMFMFICSVYPLSRPEVFCKRSVERAAHGARVHAIAADREASRMLGHFQPHCAQSALAS